MKAQKGKRDDDGEASCVFNKFYDKRKYAPLGLLIHIYKRVAQNKKPPEGGFLFC
jgi:hypothetical protein